MPPSVPPAPSAVNSPSSFELRRSKFSAALPPHRPALLLAPMQDVTDLPFWRIQHHYGGPDIYFTEYLRVHPSSRPEPRILRCLEQNPSRHPAIVQMIGQSIPDLVRTAAVLHRPDALAIDLNLGCPAPVVCRKNSGGGMLRDLPLLDRTLAALRAAIPGPFTVKTRIGFHDPSEFDAILTILSRHHPEAVTVHARTVREMYKPVIHPDRIRQAVDTLPCPVFANGNILTAHDALHTARTTGARGLMIGRGAIRNPWLWNQIRELYEHGRVLTQPSRRDLRAYIHHLYRDTRPDGLPERLHVAKMKKYLSFIAQGLSPGDAFLHEVRRVHHEAELFASCDRYLDSDQPFDPAMPAGALANPGNPRTDCH